MDSQKASTFIDGLWDGDIVPTLTDYIRIPNKSPAFDPAWEANGHMDRAVEMFASWARDKLQAFEKASVNVARLPGRTPLIFIEIPGSPNEHGRVRAAATSDNPTVLMYGHLDKQPFGEGWLTDPCDPVIKDGLLYGRGSVDDGYAFFSAVLCIKACQDLGLKHPRVVITIEGSEEGEM